MRNWRLSEIADDLLELGLNEQELLGLGIVNSPVLPRAPIRPVPPTGSGPSGSSQTASAQLTIPISALQMIDRQTMLVLRGLSSAMDARQLPTNSPARVFADDVRGIIQMLVSAHPTSAQLTIPRSALQMIARQATGMLQGIQSAMQAGQLPSNSPLPEFANNVLRIVRMLGIASLRNQLLVVG